MTATKSNNPGRGSLPGGGYALRSIFKFLVSVRLTITVLSLIAATSVLGSFIKQGGTEEEYLALYPEKTYHFIKLFGFDDAYHSTWFYFLMVLFAVNLVLCTIRRIARRKKGSGDAGMPDIKGLVAAGSGFSAPSTHKEEITRRIAGRYRKKTVLDGGTLYEKGSLSRHGAILIHASILVILVGGFIGLVAGFKGFMVMRVGETGEKALLRDGKNTHVPLGFKIKCKDFRISFYPGGEPKEYVSTVEILDASDRIVMERQIRVNEPLSYKGVRLYQANYGKTNRFEFLVNGKKVLLGEQEVYSEGKTPFMVARFAPEVHNFGPGVMIAYLEEDQKPKTAWLLANVEKMRSGRIPGAVISLERIEEEYYTGLEISRDPGVPVVLFGFALMLFGLYVNFFISHNRIYVVDNGDSLNVAGFASRNKEGFREELKVLKEGLT